MASTYSSNLNIEIITSGEQAGTWGDTTNQNWKRIEESRSYATQDLGGSTAVVNWTLPDTVDAYTTAALGSSSSGRASFVKFTNGNSGGTTVNIRGNGTGDDPSKGQRTSLCGGSAHQVGGDHIAGGGHSMGLAAGIFQPFRTTFCWCTIVAERSLYGGDNRQSLFDHFACQGPAFL